ncbi:unnamed protein product [Didymodactylos carnosus]|uniref:NHL repeat-containing protein n=1 Tax=Didymodactylos carnosus TaxID=1234261 RepID=A0A814IK78_9BILA|nr:unnamed protein product [Didymodactylos carnosus]CAF3795149.1 unnamed protein product [Didymodactylos carnosus]
MKWNFGKMSEFLLFYGTIKPACASVYNTTGLKLPINPDGSTIMNYPFGIFIDANDVVYVADMNNNRVLMWMQGASAGTAIIQSTQPQGVYVDSSGYVYVVSKDNSQYISKYPPGINQTATLIGPVQIAVAAVTQFLAIWRATCMPATMIWA